MWSGLISGLNTGDGETHPFIRAFKPDRGCLHGSMAFHEFVVLSLGDEHITAQPLD
jgi:hypothetical protein